MPLSVYVPAEKAPFVSTFPLDVVWLTTEVLNTKTKAGSSRKAKVIAVFDCDAVKSTVYVLGGP